MELKTGWTEGAAEEVVGGYFWLLGRSSQDVRDSEGYGVDPEAQAAAVVSGDEGVPVDGNLQGVGKAVVFGHRVADHNGGSTLAGGAINLLIADRKLLIGVGLEGHTAKEFDAKAYLRM